MDKLMLCALLSKAVYGKGAPDDLGIIGFEYIVDNDTDTFAMAFITDGEIIIAVRGSESRKDWLNDFKIIKTMFFGVKAHRGFAMCAGSILSKVGAILKEFPEKKIILTALLSEKADSLTTLATRAAPQDSALPKSSLERTTTKAR